MNPRDVGECWSTLQWYVDPATAIYKRKEKKEETKVIFNPPATILYMNGKKYVSKAHEEDFNEEKGLLMCIAKANGISHLELKRMIKNAKRPDKK